MEQGQGEEMMVTAMTVAGLLGAGDFLTLKRPLAWKLGLSEAAMLCELVDEWMFWNGKDKLGPSGEFFATVEKINFRTGLEKAAQRGAVRRLQAMGLIACWKLSVPGQGIQKIRHFWLNWPAIFDLTSKAIESYEQEKKRRKDKFEGARDDGTITKIIQHEAANSAISVCLKSAVREEESCQTSGGNMLDVNPKAAGSDPLASDPLGSDPDNDSCFGQSTEMKTVCAAAYCPSANKWEPEETSRGPLDDIMTLGVQLGHDIPEDLASEIAKVSDWPEVLEKILKNPGLFNPVGLMIKHGARKMLAAERAGKLYGAAGGKASGAAQTGAGSEYETYIPPELLERMKSRKGKSESDD